mmetsp:Transcript_51605/g.154933  ORF Transcript_51605/g.154933 Transcript_51605/m.154933 type:complete len:237 (-) Transcript_51605:113-823(-)
MGERTRERMRFCTTHMAPPHTHWRRRRAFPRAAVPPPSASAASTTPPAPSSSPSRRSASFPSSRNRPRCVPPESAPARLPNHTVSAAPPVAMTTLRALAGVMLSLRTAHARSDANTGCVGCNTAALNGRTRLNPVMYPATFANMRNPNSRRGFDWDFASRIAASHSDGSFAVAREYRTMAIRDRDATTSRYEAKTMGGRSTWDMAYLATYIQTTKVSWTANSVEYRRVEDGADPAG